MPFIVHHQSEEFSDPLLITWMQKQKQQNQMSELVSKLTKQGHNINYTYL